MRECDFKGNRFTSPSAEIKILKFVTQRYKNPTRQLKQNCNTQGKLHCWNCGCKKKCDIFCIPQVHSLIKKPQNCRPRDMIPFALFYRKFVTKYLISAGRLTAQITKNPGMCMGVINSWHGWQCCWWRDMLCWTWSLKTVENWLKILAAGAMRWWRSGYWEEGWRQTAGLQPWSSKERTSIC